MAKKKAVAKKRSAWKKGPLPPNTWGWGGVFPVGGDGDGWFYFADFRGDHVLLMDGSKNTLRPEEVLYYDNSLELPPIKGCSRTAPIEEQK